MDKKERIQKLISISGVASRRAAESLINEGKVLINGKVATLGDKGSFSDDITVDGISIQKQEKVYYLLNKPTGTICTLKDPMNRTIVTSLINDNRYIFPVGRLDYNTTGTLLITNDGELSQKLTHPSFEIKRVYRARLSEPLTREQLNFLNSDKVMIDGKHSKQEVTQVDTRSFVVVLTSGMNHHVKKLFQLVNRSVVQLTRIEFAGLTHVGSLEKGQYRKLKPKEIKWLMELTSAKKTTKSNKEQ